MLKIKTISMHGRFKMRRVCVFAENEVGEGRVWLLVTDTILNKFLPKSHDKRICYRGK